MICHVRPHRVRQLEHSVEMDQTWMGRFIDYATAKLGMVDAL